MAQLDKAMTVSSSMARRMAAVTRGELGVGEVDRRHRGEWLDEASVYDAARAN